MNHQVIRSLVCLAALLGASDVAWSQPPGAEDAKLKALLAKIDPKHPVKVRIEAMDQLGAMEADAMPAARKLCVILLEKSPSIREAAGNALKRIHPRLQPHVQKLTTTDKYLVELNAISGIAKLVDGGEPAAPVLMWCLQAKLTFLTSRVEWLKTRKTVGAYYVDLSEAATADGQFGTLDNRGGFLRTTFALNTQLGKDEFTTGVASAVAICEIATLGVLAKNDANLVKFLADSGLRHAFPEIRDATVQVLGWSGSEAKYALPRLELLKKKDASAKVREAAATAIARIKD